MSLSALNYETSAWLLALVLSKSPTGICLAKSKFVSQFVSAIIVNFTGPNFTYLDTESALDHQARLGPIT